MGKAAPASPTLPGNHAAIMRQPWDNHGTTMGQPRGNYATYTRYTPYKRRINAGQPRGNYAATTRQPWGPPRIHSRQTQLTRWEARPHNHQYAFDAAAELAQDAAMRMRF